MQTTDRSPDRSSHSFTRIGTRPTWSSNRRLVRSGRRRIPSIRSESLRTTSTGLSRGPDLRPRRRDARTRTPRGWGTRARGRRRRRVLTEWLLETDGEFLLVAADKETDRLGLLNDPLARLPTYYFHDGETFLFSRELRYLINEAPIEGFDPMGVAQCLLFGYSLGDRTLIDGANRLRPGTKLTIDPERGAVTERRRSTGSTSVSRPTRIEADRETLPNSSIGSNSLPPAIGRRHS